MFWWIHSDHLIDGVGRTVSELLRVVPVMLGFWVLTAILCREIQMLGIHHC